MSTSQTKYAIDLSNEGVALWHRDDTKKWVLLGKVALDAADFSKDIEALKNGHATDEVLVARVRIPRSEVFVSPIGLDKGDADQNSSQIAAFLGEKTPYTADELIYDLESSSDDGPSYVAAVTKQTLSEAKEFVTAHGFQAAYYTTKFDKTDFPRDARFYDGTPPPVVAPVAAPVPTPEPVVETPPVVETAKTEPVSEPEKADPLPTPPAPKPAPETKPVEATKTPAAKPDAKDATPVAPTKAPVVTPPAAPEKTDFSNFETVRAKELVAPKKETGKKEPTLPKGGAMATPAPRLSIGLSDADAKRTTEKPIGVAATKLKTPQGRTATGGLAARLKPRHILILLALLVFGLGYWFVQMLFDGKDDIARLDDPVPPATVAQAPAETTQTTEATDDTTDEVEAEAITTPDADEVAEVALETEAETPTELEEPTAQEDAPVEDIQTAEQTPEVAVSETEVDTSTKDAEILPEAPEQVVEESAPTADVEATQVAEAEAEVEIETAPDAEADVETAAPEVVAENIPTAPETDDAQQTAEAAVVPETAPNEDAAVTPVAEAVETQDPPETETTVADLVPTEEGVLGAEGITLFSGTPDITPPAREQLKISPDPLKNILPRMRSNDFAEIHKAEIEAAAQESTTETAELDAPVAEETPVEEAEAEPPAPQDPDLLALADQSLNTVQPRARPGVIAERAQEIAAATLAPPADPELASSKPHARPRSLVIVQEEVQPEPVPEQVDPNEITNAIQQAVLDTARPRARPRNLARQAARLKAAQKENIEQEQVQTASLTPRAARGTSRPSSAATANSVQRNATEQGKVNKRRMSLIGVYGTASSRRALVRMPSGRYVKVTSGQSFNGWNVAAIGESSVRITKGSRNQVLRMPQ